MPWIEQLRSADWNRAGCICLAAYALGCFTAGYYLVRWRTGQDIRAVGSGSVGARNVGRLLGWRGFLATVIVDFGKGVLAVWVGRELARDDQLVALAMPAVVAGHLWPVQLRFRGGKGMAAAVGALLIYDYWLAGLLALLFAAGFAVVRGTVVPGLFALACLPLVSWWLGRTGAEVSCCSMLAGLVLIAHRKNLTAALAQLLRRRQTNPDQDPHKL